MQVFSAANRLELTDLKIKNTVAFLSDIQSSGSKNSPMTSGLFRMGRGEALPYEYEFDEYKIVLEGEIDVFEENGTIHHLKTGDLVRFSPGDKVKFSSRSSGLTFYVAQR